jgi:hypothetical protein
MYIQNGVRQPEGRDSDVCGENIKTDSEEINCENMDCCTHSVGEISLAGCSATLNSLK